MLAFVVWGLVFSLPSQEIGLGKHLRNDLRKGMDETRGAIMGNGGGKGRRSASTPHGVGHKTTQLSQSINLVDGWMCVESPVHCALCDGECRCRALVQDRSPHDRQRTMMMMPPPRKPQLISSQPVSRSQTRKTCTKLPAISCMSVREARECPAAFVNVVFIPR